MPKTIVDLTVQAKETREFISQEGVKFTIQNDSAGFKKVRLQFVYSKGRKPKTPRATAPVKETDAKGSL